MKAAFLLVLTILVGCAPTPEVKTFGKGEFPSRLQDWGLLYIDEDTLVVNDQTVPYDLKSSLFTDYASKLRTVFVPDGMVATIGSEIDLPVGSILTKTFFYPADKGTLHTDDSRAYGQNGLRLDKVQLIETRLLVHLPTGWVGLPYIWNEQQTQATLEITGGVKQLLLTHGGENLSFDYVIPDFNQCQGCHIENLSTGEMNPVGFKSRHLDKSFEKFSPTTNQLDRLVSMNWLSRRPESNDEQVDWQNDSHSLDDRARSYLDINCGHCHNPTGPADTSGMFLSRDTIDPLRLGVCKPPVAAGQGTGGRPVGIFPGEPDQSILTFRMSSLDLGAMMPELGRSITHKEGVQLIEKWVSALEGGC